MQSEPTDLERTLGILRGQPHAPLLREHRFAARDEECDHV
jgi:hypothetical protein